jgi:hypothetical protein
MRFREGQRVKLRPMSSPGYEWFAPRLRLGTIERVDYMSLTVRWDIEIDGYPTSAFYLDDAFYYIRSM